MGDTGDLNSRLEIAASSSIEEAELRYSAEVLSGREANRQQIQLAALCTLPIYILPMHTACSIAYAHCLYTLHITAYTDNTALHTAHPLSCLHCAQCALCTLPIHR